MPKKLPKLTDREKLEIEVSQIQMLTPYLDELYYEIKTPGGPRHKKGSKPPTKVTRKPLTPEMKAAAWFYVHNGNNQTDAYRRAYLPGKKISTKREQKREAVRGYELFSRPYIKQAVKKIQAHIAAEIREGLEFDIVTQYKIMATYDPFDIIDKEGNLKYDSIKDMPKHLRYCIKSIKYRAGMAHVTLVDRKQALDSLLEMCPELLKPVPKQTFRHEHVTLNTEGEVVGLNVKAMSTDELREFIAKHSQTDPTQDRLGD